MYYQIFSGTIYGIEPQIIKVEVDVTHGFPVFSMVGYLASQVKEAKERVLTALKNSNYKIPPKRMIINLSPGHIKKEGVLFDVAIALAILGAEGLVFKRDLRTLMVLGELTLDGTVCKGKGILPLVSMAKDLGMRMVLIPAANLKEVCLIQGIEIVGIKYLSDAISFMQGKTINYKIDQVKSEKHKEYQDFSSLYGQEFLKRAIAIAVAGRHHLLMIGPPGSGKTLAAQCIPSIMPDLTDEETLEITKIYSAMGMLNEDGIIRARPFRKPHYSITEKAFIGGGKKPVAGEITLAHQGILFLDEFSEFKKNVIEAMRIPLEEKKIEISRMYGKYEFPADFMLVAAMNPCPCGYGKDSEKCTCLGVDIKKYYQKISGAILDRIDICIETSKINYQSVLSYVQGTSSTEIKEKVISARLIQQKRYRDKSFVYNSQIPSKETALYCPIKQQDRQYLEGVLKHKKISPRGYYKLLKTARTIADIENSHDIERNHINEALCYHWSFE